MIDVGRICVKIAGRDAGKKCVVVDFIDDNFVLIDGETRRRKCNIMHLEPLDKSVEIKKGASHAEVAKVFEQLGYGVNAPKTKPKKARPRKARKSKLATQKPAAKAAAPAAKAPAKAAADKPAENKPAAKPAAVKPAAERAETPKAPAENKPAPKPAVQKKLA
jgi:large subunit ribosomal protein L14e